MSWDAYLTDDRGHTEDSWNYTHNTSGMIYAVLVDVGIEPARDRPPLHGLRTAWWQRLDGMDGPAGAGP